MTRYKIRPFKQLRWRLKDFETRCYCTLGALGVISLRYHVDRTGNDGGTGWRVSAMGCKLHRRPFAELEDAQREGYNFALRLIRAALRDLKVKVKI